MKSIVLVLISIIISLCAYSQNNIIEEMKKEILQKVETDKKAFRDSNLLLEYKYVSNQDKEYSHSNRIELTRFMHIGGFSIRIYLYSKLSDVSEVSVSVEKYEGTWRGFSNKNIETEPLMLVADHTHDNIISYADYRITETTQFVFYTNFNNENKNEEYWMAISIHPD